jgi:Subtilase family
MNILTTQPLIGIIDTGFDANIPGVDFSEIILGTDLIKNQSCSSVSKNFEICHGSLILRLIKESSISSLSLWVGRAIGSGRWTESLVEFVETAKILGYRNAVLNLSFDLAQLNPDGSITTRDQLTAQEQAAIEYAQENGILMVVASGNQNSTMSALGRASQVYENIITVGASEGLSRATYSSYGEGLTPGQTHQIMKIKL